MVAKQTLHLGRFGDVRYIFSGNLFPSWYKKSKLIEHNLQFRWQIELYVLCVLAYILLENFSHWLLTLFVKRFTFGMMFCVYSFIITDYFIFFNLSFMPYGQTAVACDQIGFVIASHLQYCSTGYWFLRSLDLN